MPFFLSRGIMKTVSTVLLICLVSLTILSAAEVQIGQRFTKVKSTWPQTIGNEKELSILDYSFLDEPVLATLFFKQKKVSGFVFIGKTPKTQPEIQKAATSAITKLAEEKGMPEKILSADISDSLLTPLKNKESLEIAQWLKNNRLFKLGIIKNNKSYLLTFSGVKIE